MKTTDPSNDESGLPVAPRQTGVVEWLLACPVKGFFVPVDSESTESLGCTPPA